MSELVALGVSHKTAPLELRERLALPEGRATGVIRELAEAPEIQEAAAISTCNRTELPISMRPTPWPLSPPLSASSPGRPTPGQRSW